MDEKLKTRIETDKIANFESISDFASFEFFQFEVDGRTVILSESYKSEYYEMKKNYRVDPKLSAKYKRVGSGILSINKIDEVIFIKTQEEQPAKSGYHSQPYVPYRGGYNKDKVKEELRKLYPSYKIAFENESRELESPPDLEYILDKIPHEIRAFTIEGLMKKGVNLPSEVLENALEYFEKSELHNHAARVSEKLGLAERTCINYEKANLLDLAVELAESANLLDMAIKLYSRIGEKNPYSFNGAIRLAQKKGDQKLVEQLQQKAIAKFEELEKFDEAAENCYEIGDLDRALINYERAGDHYSAADIAKELNQTEKFLELLGKSVKSYIGKRQYSQAIFTYYKHGMMDEAAKVFNTIMDGTSHEKFNEVKETLNECLKRMPDLKSKVYTNEQIWEKKKYKEFEELAKQGDPKDYNRAAELATQQNMHELAQELLTKGKKYHESKGSFLTAAEFARELKQQKEVERLIMTQIGIYALERSTFTKAKKLAEEIGQTALFEVYQHLDNLVKRID